MKLYTTLIFILSALISGRGQNVNSDKFVGIDSAIHQLMEQHHTVGLAVAVIEAGQITLSKGYGYRDLEAKTPVNAQTVFAIGSVSKGFTAALLGKLEGKGELRLTDRPAQYIPELRFYNALMDSTIQIRHLLSHSTGISSFPCDASSFLFSSDDRNDLIPRLAYLRPADGVGNQFRYNNFLYTVAGIIGERITGDNWAANLQSMIFEPLNMSQSYGNPLEAAKNTNFAKGYAVRNGQPVPVLQANIPTIAPGGTVHSNLQDMTKWLMMWMREGRVDSTQLLPLEYVQAATQPQQFMGVRPNAAETGGAHFQHYGYGWMCSDYYGYYKVEHSGDISGYCANLVYYPAENIGIVVLSNQTSSNITYEVTKVLEDYLLPLERTVSDTTVVRYGEAHHLIPDTFQTAINDENPTSHALKDFVGVYNHGGFGNIRVTYENGILYADFPFTKYRLQHHESNVFLEHFSEEVPLVVWPFMEFDFVANEEGVIDTLRLNFDNPLVEFKRI